MNKAITSLKTNDGNVITNQEELLKEEVTYYKALYKRDSKVSSNEYEHFKESIDLPRLTEEEKMSCEGKLSYKECFEALQGMTHNKSPGYDGLTVEFYKHF